jgi:hypothetical protein
MTNNNGIVNVAVIIVFDEELNNTIQVSLTKSFESIRQYGKE